ncbi:hypothetical protein FE772_06545 [Lysobacter enzymogenes]|nr:hypothetical protein FE772_06545 [Lysobacter enzymogenes]
MAHARIHARALRGCGTWASGEVASKPRARATARVTATATAAATTTATEAAIATATATAVIDRATFANRTQLAQP